MNIVLVITQYITDAGSLGLASVILCSDKKKIIAIKFGCFQK
jgi:hypothetical protein